MTSKSRLTFSSLWAFEDVGVQELENQVKKSIPQLDCHCEYSKADDVLIIKGNLEGLTTQIAQVVSSYISEQKNKDLLDTPRVRQLDIPVGLQDDPNISMTELDDTHEEELLALGDVSDETLIPHSFNRIAKFWISSSGGIGCFSTGFHEFLREIATATGTEITIINDLKGIKVSGNIPGDVDDALKKLTRIEKPLSCVVTPKVTNMGGVSSNGVTNYLRIQNYSNLNPMALRRIINDPCIMDPAMSSGLFADPVFVTVSLSHNEETREYHLPANILNPPRIGAKPGESRIWSGFTFQGVGNGDQFLRMESIVEKDPPAPDALPEVFTSHMYLTAEKARQVNQWVDEGVVLDQTTTPSSKRAPGIKSRRAVASGQKISIPQTQPPEPGSNLVKVIEPKPQKSTRQSPRKFWKMEYGAEEETFSQKKMSVPGDSGGKISDDLSGNSLMPAAATTVKASVSREFLPSTFGPTNNGSDKPSCFAMNNSTSHDPQVPRANENLPPSSNRRPLKGSELIDVFVPANIANANTYLPSFDQPALVPQKSFPGDILNENKLDSQGLSGLDLTSSINPHPETNSSSSESLAEQAKRLDDVRTRHRQEGSRAHPVFNARDHQSRTHHYIRTIVGQERLAELQRHYTPEGRQAVNEVVTREYYQTMNHRAAKSGSKPKGKSEFEAKKQATLEDAWGMIKKPAKTASPNIPGNAKTLSKNEQGIQQLQTELCTNDEIKPLFEALHPTLEAAECFPGPLNLEIQFGLILIPLLPKTYRENLITLNEWTKIFQPCTGIAPPTTKFINRLTTSGSDIDHIVDLKATKAEGKRRLFEEGDSEHCVFYEYHCRTKADELLIITVNEQGKYTIRKPAMTLGSVNLHFPGQVWDANIAVTGTTQYCDGTNPEFEEAAQYLSSHIWVQPDKPLLRIFTAIPPGSKIIVEKILMRRWTRHRYIPLEDVSSKSTNMPNTAANSAVATNPAKLATTAKETEPRGRENVGEEVESTSEKSTSESQDIFLQVTEVQDLVIGTSPSDTQAIRARCASLPEMLKNGRQWYEVSLVSPAIEAVLKANANIEVGERTGDWRSADLFGNDVIATNQGGKTNQSSVSSPSPSPVAAAIGAAGIGDLFRLTKTVLAKIDGVGFWNNIPADPASGPSVEARMPATDPLQAPSGIRNAGIQTQPKGYEFDELESIKEAGSAAGNTPAFKGSFAPPSAKVMEQDFW